jgi:hypothetical protein
MMINSSLYSALDRVFGTVQLSRESDPGEYSYKSAGNVGQKFRNTAMVSDWGEAYKVCCPVCDDRTFRLYFSHLWGMKGRAPDKKVIWFNKRSLCICYNERCNISPYFQEISKHMKDAPELSVQPGDFTKFVQNEVELPKQCIPISSDHTPEEAVGYLRERHFDIPDLERDFMVKFVPAGTKLWERADGSDMVLMTDRILIPILQGRQIIAWQARDIDGDDSLKYLSMRGFKKSRCLYNMDGASMHPDIVITEGVTDVWRIGPQAIALFGKDMSRNQLRLMKTLWSFDGCCAIALDKDAERESSRICRLLEKEKVFPRGVFQIHLERGDPADYERNEILDLIEAAGQPFGWQAERGMQHEDARSTNGIYA